MPTGYTAKLYDGPQSFKEFVFECAKAFFWAFRDAGLNADFESTVDAWHKDRLAEMKRRVREAKAELKKWEGMDIDGTLRELKSSYRSRLKDYEKEGPVSKARGERFQKMHDQVKAWEVPAEDLLLCNLKKFMLEQLSHDLPRKDSYYAKPPEEPTRKDATDYLAHETVYVRRRVAEAEKELADAEIAIANQKKSIKTLKGILETM